MTTKNKPSVPRRSGLPELALLPGLYMQVFRCAWRIFGVNGRARYPALVVARALRLLPEFGSVPTRPREPWLFVRLPLALAAAEQLQPHLRIGVVPR